MQTLPSTREQIVRTLLALIIGIALTSIGGQSAAQSINPLPPVLLDGSSSPAPSSGSNGDGVDRADIYFSEDWENVSVGQKTADFTDWVRVGAGGSGIGTCSITEVVASGGPKGGRAFRAYLEKSGTTCGRSEFKLNDTNYDELRATHIGSLPVPTIDTADSNDHWFYRYDEAASCTSNCLPQAQGYMFSALINRMPTTGETEILMQMHDQGGIELTPDGRSAVIVLAIEIGDDTLDVLLRRNATNGGNDLRQTIATPATFGVPDFEGETLEFFIISRWDSRTDAQGGDGRHEVYVNLEGRPSGTPKFVWNGQTMHTGQSRYTLNGQGPLVVFFSHGVYHDVWTNSGNTTPNGQAFDVTIDNLMFVKNPVLDELQVEMARPNFQ